MATFRSKAAIRFATRGGFGNHDMTTARRFEVWMPIDREARLPTGARQPLWNVRFSPARLSASREGLRAAPKGNQVPGAVATAGAAARPSRPQVSK
ncbi:MAG: hypothetical protein AMXMBFR64_59350 [Myxococcales bacterium]